MTNTPRPVKTVNNKSIKKATNKSVKQSAKKGEAYLGVKSAILMLSIVGTMGGWLVLLNQENSYAQVTEQTALSFEQVVTDNNLTNWDDEAAKPMAVSMTNSAGESMTNNASNQSIDINQLRQVNAVAPVPNQPVRVVATTQSSR